jgi:hypothetical protein
MAVKRIRINEDFDQRLNYLMKQYGKGWLYSDSGFATVFNENNVDIDHWEWDDYNDKIAYVTMNRTDIYKNQERVNKPQINDIGDNIIKLIYDDAKRFAKGVPLRLIASEMFVLGDCVSVSIPVDIEDYYGDAENIDYPNGVKYNPRGKYTISINYMFKLNGKLVRGEFLSLLTGFKLIR